MAAARIQERPTACPNMHFNDLVVLLSIPKAPIVCKSQEDGDEQNSGKRILRATASSHMLLKFEHVLNEYSDYYSVPSGIETHSFMVYYNHLCTKAQYVKIECS
jgi:hypothetical protein